MTNPDRFSHSVFKRGDDAVLAQFVKGKLIPKLLDFRMEQSQHAELLDDEYRAENFFYGRFYFDSSESARQVRFTATQTFLDWAYMRLVKPRGTKQELGRDSSTSEGAFAANCAINYLLKNFWHNFVHHRVQGINDSNFHEFRGEARNESDFEADNLANLFLVLSYGLPVYTSGRMGEQNAKKIAALFRRNRCNLVFAERASHRSEDTASMTDEQRFEELEWRYRRAVANHVGQRLLCQGMAVRSIGVYLTGSVARKGGKFFREGGQTVVSLNSRRINSLQAPYTPNDEMVGAPPARAERRHRIRQWRATRLDEIATIVTGNYRQELKDSAFRDHAANQVSGLLGSLGLPS